MAALMYDRFVRDDEYRQRVRRHRPSSLLPLIASAGARYGRPDQYRAWLGSPFRKYTPWALADAARVALTYGTEFNRSAATEHDLLEILAAYSALMDPTLHSNGDDAIRLRDFLLRTAGEQLAWQEPDFATLARTAAVFLHTPFPDDRTPRHMLPGWDTELFGCSLTDFVGAAQLLWASALVCQGRFDPSFLDTADAAGISDIVSRDTIVRVLERQFAIDTAAFKQTEHETNKRLEAVPQARNSQLRRFTYNPLIGRPAVTGYGDTWLLCPVPQLVHRKAGPAGIYHAGGRHFGRSFAVEMGYLFEQYIGRQLRLLTHAEVHPEITYTVRRQEMRSVDWIVVFDDLVLLVEVKSTMPTENARLGLVEGAEDTVEKIGRAYRQINNTEERIASAHPAFAAIPRDRPRHGLVVTLEPFHLVNAPFKMPDLPTTRVFTTVASAREVEQLVTLPEDAAATRLLERAADPERSTWDLNSTVLSGHAGRNPILDAAWAAYPWRAARITEPQQPL
ncbi:hypothetical protein ABZW30_42020 [Kitasatospora sp. NPDC004669]|uniref:hypothetical protein n=1 Tax=Kitasatospora sp. NPDC004669 TaxID=3154555 RepID=UPI0033B895FF